MVSRAAALCCCCQWEDAVTSLPAPLPCGLPTLPCPGCAGAAGEPAHYEHRLTNVEYTEFERLGFADQAVGNGSTLSKFPANTNVLFIGLQVRCMRR